jgi:Cu/Ag efflux pump CusA
VRLEDVATIEHGMGPVEVFHYGASRVSQLFVSVDGSDLAGAAADIEGIIRHFPVSYALDSLPADKYELAADEVFVRRLGKYLKDPTRKEAQALQKEYGVDVEKLRLPRGLRIQVRGEVQAMRHSFADMAFSLVLAVMLVYLVLAAQFASWLDPLIMIVSAPLGLVGVAIMLWGTGTSLNIQSCMGVLMMVGISMSSSVLLVEFANRQREKGMSVRDAVLSAACVRLRPILMTTTATLVGLAPMAIHRHPGDEMNLPLARAVIGGLAGSMLLTLFVVPVLYTLLKPQREQVVTADQVVLPPEAPPPSDPAATFAVHMPSDWGGSAFEFEDDPPQKPENPDQPPQEGRP